MKSRITNVESDFFGLILKLIHRIVDNSVEKSLENSLSSPNSGKCLLKTETAKRPRIRNLIGKSYKHEKELLWITFSQNDKER